MLFMVRTMSRIPNDLPLPVAVVTALGTDLAFSTLRGVGLDLPPPPSAELSRSSKLSPDGFFGDALAATRAGGSLRDTGALIFFAGRRTAFFF